MVAESVHGPVAAHATVTIDEARAFLRSHQSEIDDVVRLRAAREKPREPLPGGVEESEEAAPPSSEEEEVEEEVEEDLEDFGPGDEDELDEDEEEYGEGEPWSAEEEEIEELEPGEPSRVLYVAKRIGAHRALSKLNATVSLKSAANLVERVKRHEPKAITHLSAISRAAHKGSTPAKRQLALVKVAADLRKRGVNVSRVGIKSNGKIDPIGLSTVAKALSTARKNPVAFARLSVSLLGAVGTAGAARVVGTAQAIASARPVDRTIVSQVRAALPQTPAAQSLFKTGFHVGASSSFSPSVVTAGNAELAKPAAKTIFDVGAAFGRAKSLQAAANITAAGDEVGSLVSRRPERISTLRGVGKSPRRRRGIFTFGS
jgi:hypothetical protein